MLERGEIEHETVGKHHRTLVGDLMVIQCDMPEAADALKGVLRNLEQRAGARNAQRQS
jgi:hypothetical protein